MEGQVEAAAEAVERAFGPIEIWVNNAMASVFSPVKQMKPEEYLRVTEVTYLDWDGSRPYFPGMCIQPRVK